MNLWNISVYLKNGIEIKGIHKGYESDSKKVAETLFSGNDNTFNAIKTEDNCTAKYFKLSEVVCFEISK